MLILGFSSGPPFFLSGNTLGYWLRYEGTTLGAIGFLSWVGLAYSLKFLWASFNEGQSVPWIRSFFLPEMSLTHCYFEAAAEIPWKELTNALEFRLLT